MRSEPCMGRCRAQHPMHDDPMDSDVGEFRHPRRPLAARFRSFSSVRVTQLLGCTTTNSGGIDQFVQFLGINLGHC